ncbi:MAG: multifunctional 2',3'-cyclic-nucleotide 2'-phosphodiesterase/5'-nucleotidase/3'-nucleotidase [Paracoccus denitrificans]|nr:MAG: multifunctional 2',3'-cyclic-nucleotide 2'-phosphodiesterase/5'-nucleotidase/3'-nucleotidase [Paracoccus denitrificans]PZO83960.1 MAG: multifunctional 2',3'-cyclic-nucleotide 2'-phosphodiesterase/5'-nucleotidase/3'-nucleotidase [Paracoccus denitrificans]
MIRALLATAATLAVTAGTAQANFVLHVLHTNDFHSRVEQVNKNDSTCDAETAAKNECFGGSARLKTEVDRLRKEIADKGEASILLDAGDQYQGSLFYNYYKGKDTVELMNLLGYDAMTVGNHEFDDGPMGLVTLLDGAKFPVVSANIDVTGSNELEGKLKPDVVLDVGDQKIGIIGATTVETPEIASPGPSLVFKDPIESIEQRAQELTDQGVDKIIALTHIGYNVDQELAAKAAGIDAIVGGHTHTFLSNDDPDADGPYPTMVKGPDGGDVPIVTALTAGKYLGHLVLEFDDKGNVVSASGAPILLDSAIPEDPAVAARVKELAQPLEELRNKQVAELKVPLNADRADCRARECIMGNVVTDAMLDRVKSQGIDIAIENGGGLRASIDAGPVTMGEVISVLPFQNTLSTFRLSGANILKALENGASQYDEGAGRFAQVAGLKYTVDPKAEVGVRISDVEVMDDGKWTPIEPAKMYGVVSNNYMRSGGDGYSVFETEGQDAYDFGPDLADVLADYLAKRGPNFAPELEGRITVKE